LGGGVVVVAGENTESGQGFFLGADSAQGVWHRPSSVSDDVGITSVGLALAWVQIRDAAHRQAGGR
jgi:hypothetical protein